MTTLRRQAHMLLACLTLAAAGCDPGFEPYSIVKDQRVLALRAEPPEVIIASINDVIPEVAIDSLWADPAAPTTPRPWTIVACVKPQVYSAGASEVRDGTGSCEDDVLAVPLAQGMAVPGDAITARFRADALLLERARQADALKGFDGQVHITIELALGAADDPLRVRAQKRIHYSLPIPAGKRPNQNPAFASLDADGTPMDPTRPLAVMAGQKVRIDPRPQDGSAEDYRVLTFTGMTRELKESLRFTYFATAGELSEEQTGGAEVVQVGTKPRDLFTEWTAPDQPGMVTMWFVIRDERGGTSWETRLVEVTPIQ